MSTNDQIPTKPVETAVKARLCLDELLPEAYAELKALARRSLSRERSGHTLQTTALVHEAYLRLLKHDRIEWTGRTHCVAVAAMAMRRILVEDARARACSKREGDRLRVSLTGLALDADGSVDLLSLEEAIAALSLEDPRKCRVVELRFFAGLSEAETADVLGITTRTVERDWRYARAWLFRFLSDASPELEA